MPRTSKPKEEEEFKLPDSPTVNDIDEMEARKAAKASETSETSTDEEEVDGDDE
mgnify:CR=1 FL=1